MPHNHARALFCTVLRRRHTVNSRSSNKRAARLCAKRVALDLACGDASRLRARETPSGWPWAQRCRGKAGSGLRSDRLCPRLNTVTRNRASPPLCLLTEEWRRRGFAGQTKRGNAYVRLEQRLRRPYVRGASSKPLSLFKTKRIA